MPTYFQHNPPRTGPYTDRTNTVPDVSAMLLASQPILDGEDPSGSFWELDRCLRVDH